MEIRYGLTDPDTLQRLTGLELLRAMVAGELPAPPMAERLGFLLAEVGEGRVAFEGVPDAGLLNPLGTVHGGYALTLIDSAAGCAVHSRLAAGTFYTTLETKVNFVRAIKPNGARVRCEGTVLSLGRQIGTAEARLTSVDGALLAHGTSTLMIFAART
ncbi:MAG TPA: PaaI family thioesterase [Allosphingosinicella sp.]